jgi:hypothetical protein
MKKTIKVILAVALIFSFTQPAFAKDSTKPTVVSFTMTPDTVDTASTNTLVSFRLIVSNATGIASTQTQVTLTDKLSNTATVQLVRTDSPVQNSLATVTFQGTLTLPYNLPNGVYWATANPIDSLNADGTIGYSTDTINASTTSKIAGAENALLVRKNGELNFSYPTFRGPAYDKTIGSSFVNSKFASAADPIWKVGESFNPNDYYELITPSLSLKVKSLSPATCISDGTILRLTAEGGCSYIVYTEKTSDYQLYQDSRTATILTARIKPSYAVGTIATQSSTVLPLVITGPYVFGINGFIIPVSSTPSVCYPTSTYVTIISGGTCTLNYSTAGTSTYLPSDVYQLTFEITRSAQTVFFITPPTASLSSKLLTLKATASSGQPISFLSSTPTICSVTGSSLNLLLSGTCRITATQIGTTTISPASADQEIVITGAGAAPKGSAHVAPKVVKKLNCIKNGKTKSVTGKNCPIGYKPKN